MGRSARWHTAEGQELLLEDGGAEDDRRDLAVVRALGISARTGFGTGPRIGLSLPTALDVILWLGATAWRRFRRGGE
jgi:hypothetical protein